VIGDEPDHIAIVVLQIKGKQSHRLALVLDHSKGPGLLWKFPGGTIEYEYHEQHWESPWTTLEREINEELGLTVEEHELEYLGHASHPNVQGGEYLIHIYGIILSEDEVMQQMSAAGRHYPTGLESYYVEDHIEVCYFDVPMVTNGTIPFLARHKNWLMTVSPTVAHLLFSDA
jgi:8-oxo-dGTP pyrophosphatase MutT (NUDIX family)